MLYRLSQIKFRKGIRKTIITNHSSNMILVINFHKLTQTNESQWKHTRTIQTLPRMPNDRCNRLRCKPASKLTLFIIVSMLNDFFDVILMTNNVTYFLENRSAICNVRGSCVKKKKEKEKESQRGIKLGFTTISIKINYFTIDRKTYSCFKK